MEYMSLIYCRRQCLNGYTVTIDQINRNIKYFSAAVKVPSKFHILFHQELNVMSYQSLNSLNL
jgi:hypothetical protein